MRESREILIKVSREEKLRGKKWFRRVKISFPEIIREGNRKSSSSCHACGDSLVKVFFRCRLVPLYFDFLLPSNILNYKWHEHTHEWEARTNSAWRHRRWLRSLPSVSAFILFTFLRRSFTWKFMNEPPKRLNWVDCQMRQKEGCSMSIHISLVIRFIDLITSLKTRRCYDTADGEAEVSSEIYDVFRRCKVSALIRITSARESCAIFIHSAAEIVSDWKFSH